MLPNFENSTKWFCRPQKVLQNSKQVFGWQQKSGHARSAQTFSRVAWQLLRYRQPIITPDLHAGAERPREKPAAPRGRERREVLEPMLIPICFSNFWLIGKFRANSAIFPEKSKIS